MASGTDSSSMSNSQDPYALLGIKPGASFEEIQKAKEKRLEEVGDDSQAKARIEASYDSLLMVSLKERQLGKASNAAVSASKKEEMNKDPGVNITGSLFARLKNFKIQQLFGVQHFAFE